MTGLPCSKNRHLQIHRFAGRVQIHRINAEPIEMTCPIRRQGRCQPGIDIGYYCPTARKGKIRKSKWFACNNLPDIQHFRTLAHTIIDVLASILVSNTVAYDHPGAKSRFFTTAKPRKR